MQPEPVATGRDAAQPGLLGPLLVVAGVAGICVLTIRMFRRQARRNAARPTTPAEVVREATAWPGAEVDRRVAESLATVRRMAAALDTKAARLEALLAEARERISELEAARDRG